MRSNGPLHQVTMSGNSISTVWYLAMMPVTSSRSRLWKTGLSAPSKTPSRIKRSLHLITFPEIPSFCGKFPSQSAESSLVTSENSTLLMRVRCCPWKSCRTSSQTPLLEGTSILLFERCLVSANAILPL